MPYWHDAKDFEHVLGHNYDADGLDLLMPQGDSPKAATAKGGIVLMSDNKGDLNDVDYDYVAEHATTWIGTNEDNAIKSYNDVNDCFEQEVAVHVKDFIDLCQNVLTQCKADKYINLPDNIDKVFEHSAFKRNIQKYVKDGCAQVANPNYEVSSSLFSCRLKAYCTSLPTNYYSLTSTHETLINVFTTMARLGTSHGSNKVAANRDWRNELYIS